MSKPELKQMIAGIDHLPTTMKAAGRALSVLFSSRPDIETAGALAGMDPALACCVLRMANTPASAAASETVLLRDAVRKAGIEGLRRAVLGATSASLPLQPYQSHIEHHLRHALTCATCAAKTASYTGIVPADEAYVAGLLHDIGRLAMVTVMPEDYCAFLESSDAANMEPREKNEFDADHALAGKWLAERWALPRQVSQAIWFHHLPPGTLLGNRGLISLVSVVGFANAMSHWILGGVPEPTVVFHKEVRARAVRLGLDYASIESLHQQTCVAVEQRLAILESDTGGGPAPVEERSKAAASFTFTQTDANAENASLKKEIKWLQTLSRLNTSLRPSQTFNEVLGLIAAAVRECLEAAPGMCCAFDERNRYLTGMTWDLPDSPPQSFRIPMSPTTEEELDEVEILALEALDQLGIGMGENGWRGAERFEPELKDGILMLPLVADGVTHGQVMFETPVEKLEDYSWDKFKLMAFAGACGAVIARHHAYDELRELSEELAEAIARTASSGPGAQADGMTEFAVGVSHALQRPLNVIANQAHLLLRRTHTPEENRAAEAILEQDRALGKLVSDLMAFARPGTPTAAPTVVNYILHKVMSTLSDRLAAKGITVVEDYEDGLPRVNADKHQLEHAILNLIVNAEMAMSQTGGQLRIETAAGQDRKSIYIRVEDTGPGIPKKYAEAIFEPFVSLREDVPGTGLGLAVCRAIVRKHGGELRLAPVVGAGAAFEITLPVEREGAGAPAAPAPVMISDRKESTARRETPSGQEDAAPQRQKPPSPAPEPPKPAPEVKRARETPFEDPEAPPMPSLLLIDENETTREVLKETLRNRGFSVIAAQDAVRAMQAVAAALFDVVLLDFELKDVPGPNMLTEIQNIRPGIPVIVVTADNHPRTVESALKRGARACLVKPFALHELLHEVEDIAGIHNN
ncbi:MAG TPA: HDOD domain-containing protein [Candidatus Hydrogenedentes bacterium]|nr:HDOD domain-containing protein [Candidatus Hydrogenedentota bacterium]